MIAAGCLRAFTHPMKREILLATTLSVLFAPHASAKLDLPEDVVSGWSFNRSLAPNFKPHGYTIASAADGHPVRAGKKSIRFEVRPGDCSWNTAGHSDCKTDRERHEFVQTGRKQKEGDEYWYAWSLYLTKSWPVVHPTKVALAQFHQSPEVVWMFRNKDGGYYVNRQKHLGRGYGFDRILGDADMRGRWNDIVVHARWTHTQKGWFRVWVNGVYAYDYSGPTMGKNTSVYFKIGIYRAFVSNYKKAFGASAVPTQIAYFDEIRRGRSRAEVTRFLK